MAARPGHRPPDLWKVWAIASGVALGLLAGKLHHEYYWLILAPAIAAGIGRGAVSLSRRPLAGWLVALLFLLSSAYLSRSTWQTPPEWTQIETAARSVREVVPDSALLAAPEALLFQADRRGCRLEFTPAAARRAAEEWPGTSPQAVAEPIDLIEFYRAHGARFFADVPPQAEDERRIALHEMIRKRYKVRMDSPSVLIAELEPRETARNGH